jgi:hypothetical protein
MAETVPKPRGTLTVMGKSRRHHDRKIEGVILISFLFWSEQFDEERALSYIQVWGIYSAVPSKGRGTLSFLALRCGTKRAPKTQPQVSCHRTERRINRVPPDSSTYMNFVQLIWPQRRYVTSDQKSMDITEIGGFLRIFLGGCFRVPPRKCRFPRPMTRILL